MPIKGLSEKRRFSRGGKIRLGQKAVSKKTGNEYPEKSDHFIFDPTDETLVPKFAELFGDKPTRITVAFPSEDPEVVFPQYYKLYGSSGLLCKGDGEVALRRTELGELEETDCPGPTNCPYAMERGVGGKPGCKQVASLQFFLPDLPVMQVFQIDTSSYNSIININSQMEILRRVAGRISFIPVVLVLKPQDATNPETGKRVQIYVLDLIVGVGLRDIARLPQLTHEQVYVAPPSDATPDDLYPRSQIMPDQAALPEPEPGPAPGPEPEPQPQNEPAKEVAMEEDPEVLAAFEATGATDIKRKAMLVSAAQNGWDKARLLECIRQNGGKRKPAPKVQPKAQVEPGKEDF